jgi:hypothetical protein
MIWIPVIFCAAGVACGLIGEWKGHAHATEESCKFVGEHIVHLMGEDAFQFRCDKEEIRK